MHKQHFKFLEQLRFWARYTSFLYPRIQISVIWIASDIRLFGREDIQVVCGHMLYYAPAKELTNERYQCFKE
jgi:hypothetical protein